MSIARKEIEIKARITDYDSLLARLDELGITLSNPSVQRDQIFWPIGSKFADLASGLPVLRIREENSQVIFTLKQRSGKRELNKIEKEVIVSNALVLKEIIELSGFFEVLQINKSRQSGQCQNYTICIDEVEGLGNFIEVEHLTSADEEKVVNDMLEFLNMLGIDKKDIIEKGYDTLLLKK